MANKCLTAARSVKIHSLFSMFFVLGLTACSIPKWKDNDYVASVEGAQVTDNRTPQTERLICLGDHIRTKRLSPAVTFANETDSATKGQKIRRFAVGRIEDYTGKQDLVNGRRLTQGAALMAISALGLTKLPMVERFDLSIAETEFKYTDNKLIGDSSPVGFRQTYAGSVPGSDFHIVGGLTEVNYNIRSGEVEGTAKYLGSSLRYAVIDVGVDLRLINTRTLEVVSVNTFRKQIIGTETRMGYFRFFNENFLDFSASERSQEPIQKAVRMVLEHSIYKLLLDLYQVSSDVCDPVKIDESSNLKLTDSLSIYGNN
jgi:curli biogenesis system outer membrane secretion channel CsgG